MLGFSCRDTGREPLSEEDLQLLYAESQLHFVDFLESWQGFAMEMSRMLPMRSYSYQDGIEPFRETRQISDLFSDFGGSSRELMRSADQRESSFIAGSTRIMRAFAYQLLIDLTNEHDLPLVSAGEQRVLNGNTAQGFLAGFPPDSNYMLSLEVLDEAILNLENSPVSPDVDIFYEGDANKWIRLANSLKLRAYNNTRLVDESAKDNINAILQEGMLIEDISEDFEYHYQRAAGREQELASLFERSYRDNADWQPPFMSNYYMWLLVGEKAVPDPRSRFYFYRQVPDFTNADRIAVCPNFDVLGEGAVLPETPQHYREIDANMPYCIANEAGYYGRDHGNGMGLAEDAGSRTLVGLYPFGGKFDDNSFESGRGNTRATGEEMAISPYFHASYLYFIRAEAALTLGTADNPLLMLEEGIRRSFEKVRSFSMVLDPNFQPDTCLSTACETIGDILNRLQAEEENYISYVRDQYNAATDANEKLDLIMKEYLIALWGNGMEAYNNYRRTAMPRNIQPLIDLQGSQPLSFPRKAPEMFGGFGGPIPYANDTVFWDNNDASLFR